MKRYGWQNRFFAYLMQVRTQPFVWGTNDCALFVARCIDLQTDSTHAQSLAGLWGDAKSAAEEIERRGGLEEAASAALGEAVPWGWCTQGDVVLAVDDGRELLCIHDGVQLVAPGEGGLRHLPVTSAICGWRVG